MKKSSKRSIESKKKRSRKRINPYVASNVRLSEITQVSGNRTEIIVGPIWIHALPSVASLTASSTLSYKTAVSSLTIDNTPLSPFVRSRILKVAVEIIPCSLTAGVAFWSLINENDANASDIYNRPTMIVPNYQAASTGRYKFMYNCADVSEIDWVEGSASSAIANVLPDLTIFGYTSSTYGTPSMTTALYVVKTSFLVEGKGIGH